MIRFSLLSTRGGTWTRTTVEVIPIFNRDVFTNFFKIKIHFYKKSEPNDSLFIIKYPGRDLNPHDCWGHPDI